MDKQPKISIVVPIHNMADGDKFLWRLVRSLTEQTFRDWELIITKDGKMAENTNAGIMRARGEIIKIIYMDDYFAHPQALENIVKNFKGEWLATGCVHDAGDGKLFNPHLPSFGGIPKGENTIGSPSVVAIKNDNPVFFDENMSWVLDVDYYQRLYKKYGNPTLLNTIDIVMGVGFHQMTNILTADEKIKEHNYLYYKNHGN